MHPGQAAIAIPGSEHAVRKPDGFWKGAGHLIPVALLLAMSMLGDPPPALGAPLLQAPGAAPAAVATGVGALAVPRASAWATRYAVGEPGVGLLRVDLERARPHAASGDGWEVLRHSVSLHEPTGALRLAHDRRLFTVHEDGWTYESERGDRRVSIRARAGRLVVGLGGPLAPAGHRLPAELADPVLYDDESLFLVQELLRRARFLGPGQELALEVVHPGYLALRSVVLRHAGTEALTLTDGRRLPTTLIVVTQEGLGAAGPQRFWLDAHGVLVRAEHRSVERTETRVAWQLGYQPHHGGCALAPLGAGAPGTGAWVARGLRLLAAAPAEAEPIALVWCAPDSIAARVRAASLLWDVAPGAPGAVVLVDEDWSGPPPTGWTVPRVVGLEAASAPDAAQLIARVDALARGGAVAPSEESVAPPQWRTLVLLEPRYGAEEAQALALLRAIAARGTQLVVAVREEASAVPWLRAASQVPGPAPLEVVCGPPADLTEVRWSALPGGLHRRLAALSGAAP